MLGTLSHLAPHKHTNSCATWCLRIGLASLSNFSAAQIFHADVARQFTVRTFLNVSGRSHSAKEVLQVDDLCAKEHCGALDSSWLRHNS